MSDEGKDNNPFAVTRRGFLRGAAVGTGVAVSAVRGVNPAKVAARVVNAVPSIGHLTGLVKSHAALKEVILRKYASRIIEAANNGIFAFWQSETGWVQSRDEFQFLSFLQQHIFEVLEDPDIMAAVLKGKGDVRTILAARKLARDVFYPEQHIDLIADMLNTHGRKLWRLSKAIQAHPLATTEPYKFREACRAALEDHWENHPGPDTYKSLFETWHAQPPKHLDDPPAKEKKPNSEAASQENGNVAALASPPYLSDDSRLAFEAMKRGGPEQADWREKAIKRNLESGKKR